MVVVARDDDIAAICGRIDSAVTYAVVVHAPRGNRQMSQELGMRRLQRHAEEAGKIVAIATRSGAVANRARMTGIPVARKPQHVRWDSGGRYVLRLGPWSLLLPRLGPLVQVVVIGLFVAAAAAVALAVVPEATVTLSPPAETLSETLVLTASGDQTTPDMDELLMPLREVSSTQRITVAVRATGKTSTPTKAAKATLTITNTGPTEVVIPNGAILVSKEGEQFLLDLQTTVPPRGVVIQSATASKLGAAGNVPAASVNRWQDAGIQGRLTVTNPQAATGGASEERPAVDAADVATVKALAKGIEQSESARRTIIAGRPRDGVFLSTAAATVSFGEPNAPAGSNADFVFLEVDITVTAKAIPAEALEALARAKLGGRAGGPLLPGTVSAFEEGSAQTNEQGELRNTFRVTARFAESFDEGEIESAVRGKSKGDAEAALTEKLPSAEPAVSVSPSWAPWLPRLGFRIKVVVVASASEAAAATTTAATTAAATATTASPTPALAGGTPAVTPTRSATPSATPRP